MLQDSFIVCIPFISCNTYPSNSIAVMFADSIVVALPAEKSALQFMKLFWLLVLGTY
jgi:hypothetical protein